jgi:hypothetical protein
MVVRPGRPLIVDQTRVMGSEVVERLADGVTVGSRHRGLPPVGLDAKHRVGHIAVSRKPEATTFWPEHLPHALRPGVSAPTLSDFDCFIS